MSEKILMKGNEALAEGSILAGCRHFFGYPITPQTELAAYMAKKMPKIGGTYLQAESEISAINMVYGAAACGARAMTSSSSPGISLKAEGISYIAGADLPAVIINVQRGGPGLGSIQPSQSDYFQATKGHGHGDYHLIVYAPSTVQEMLDYPAIAFDKADEYRTPVMILSDGLLGQMMEPVVLREARDLSTLPKKPWATVGHGNAREHNVVNSLFLQSDDLEKSVLARQERYDIIEAREQMADTYLMDDAEFAIVAFGASARISKGAIDLARAAGIKVGLIRPITLWPFPQTTFDKYAGQIKEFLSVEMNMGQMIYDVRLAVHDSVPVRFYGRTGGMIPTPEAIFEVLKDMEGGK